MTFESKKGKIIKMLRITLNKKTMVPTERRINKKKNGAYGLETVVS